MLPGNGGGSEQAFGEVVCRPREDLRHGLVLGGEEFWQKAGDLTAKSKGNAEVRWRRRVDVDELSRRTVALVERETYRRVAIWLRVRVAAAYGYRDGSGVHRVVKRLEEAARGSDALSKRLETLARIASSVKI